MVRRNWCIKNLGWKDPKRYTVTEMAMDGVNQTDERLLSTAVYWFDQSITRGIENTFIYCGKPERFVIHGAVVADFSNLKFRTTECMSE